MNVPELLSAFRTAGLDDSDLGSLLHASKFTVTRLRMHETDPTASMEASIRGLYTDYQLLGRSKMLLRMRYGRHGTDQYYAFPNPLQEQARENQPGENR